MNDKVKVTSRIMAYLLDILLVFVIIGMVNSIPSLNPYYEKYSDSVKSYNEILKSIEDGSGSVEISEYYDLIKTDYYNVNKYSIVPSLIVVVFLILYFVVFQKFNNGQTLGKKIMGIKVVDESDNNPSIWKYLLRESFIYFMRIGCIIPILINVIALFITNELIYLQITLYGTLAFVVIGIISLVMSISGKDNKAIHDIITHTKVVNVKKEV